jgi:hypothetical protein
MGFMRIFQNKQAEGKRTELDKRSKRGKQARPGSYKLDNLAEAEELALEQALTNFRLSVHAWSEAAYSRPRTAGRAAVGGARHGSWRLAAGWALGCALLVGGISGTLTERHHRQELARQAARMAEQHEQQRLDREQQTREEEDLLAKVDSEVAREVPSAMEPLARLMDEDASQ